MTTFKSLSYCLLGISYPKRNMKTCMSIKHMLLYNIFHKQHYIIWEFPLRRVVKKRLYLQKNCLVWYKIVGGHICFYLTYCMCLWLSYVCLWVMCLSYFGIITSSYIYIEVLYLIYLLVVVLILYTIYSLICFMI